MDIQNASSTAALPTPDQIKQWVNTALNDRYETTEMTVKIVNESEVRNMNSQYHDRDYATNVLSFLVELPEEVDSDLLGDLVICAAVVELEAAERVRLWMHTGHLVVHGCPHFLGVRSSAG